MGFRFRKSVKMGPFRVNFSKSGVGYSVGTKGYRVTKKANGGIRTTASIPGTGISHVKDYSAKQVAAVSRTASPRKKERDVKGSLCAVLLAGIIILAFVVACSSCGAEPAESADPETDISTVQPTVDDFVQPEPDPEVVPDIPEAEEPKPEPEPAPEPVVKPEPEPEPESEPVPAPEPEPTPEPEPAPAPAPDPTPVVVPVPVPDPEPEPESVPEPEPEPAPEPEPKPEPKPESSAAAYIGNKNSFVFHDLNCGSVTRMKDKNKVPLSSRDEAISRGFDPCDNCKP